MYYLQLGFFIYFILIFILYHFLKNMNFFHFGFVESYNMSLHEACGVKDEVWEYYIPQVHLSKIRN